MDINKINRFKEQVDVKDITFISQNCIGGVIYHDTNNKFISPTINLYFKAEDFIKFVENIDKYLSIEPKMDYNEKDGVIGYIDDIKLYFSHYNSKIDALQKWEERKTRINKNNIFVINTDRDGFNNELLERYTKIKYSKVLFTRNEKIKDLDFVIYLEKYKNKKEINNTIPNREFYNDDKFIFLIKQHIKENKVKIKNKKLT